MRVNTALIAAMAALGFADAAFAAEKLIVDSWGGNFPKAVTKFVSEKFKAETGADIEFVTGGTIDRLNKAKLMKGTPESDVTFTTAHVGWLYVNDGLFEKLDFSKLPNAKGLFTRAKISDYHIGVYGYVYTVAYRKDLAPKDIKFDTWEDLWRPELKGMVSMADFDPSHIVSVATSLVGADTQNWEKAQDKLMALKPNIKAFYSNDANSIQLLSSGETPVQIVLSANGYHMVREGVPIEVVVPKEGAVLNIDSVGIAKGTKNADLAYKFINIALSPEVQKAWTESEKLSPVVADVHLSADVAGLPGVMASEEDWKTGTLPIDQKVRAEKLSEWRKWFIENMIAK